MIRSKAFSTHPGLANRLILHAVVLCAMCLLLTACAGKKTHEADSVRGIVVTLAAKKADDPDVPGLSVAVLRHGQDAPVQERVHHEEHRHQKAQFPPRAGGGRQLQPAGDAAQPLSAAGRSLARSRQCHRGAKG